MPKTGKTFPQGGLKVRGFFRVNLVEHDVDGTPKIVGDSGWKENQITQLGLANMAQLLSGQAGSSAVLRGALGTGTVPAFTATTLPGEFGDATAASSTANRPPASITTAISAVSTINISYFFTWLSAQSFNTSNRTIQNIGLVPAVGAIGAGTIFAGATFATSQLSNNQDVQATYVIQLRT
jgi:hypothetical protein